MNHCVPAPPVQQAFRSISECRVHSSFQLFRGQKLLIYKHIDPHSFTEYYIELVNKLPCVVTYVNHKRVDVRDVRAV